MDRFKNKVAVVTGAGEGIGLAICHQLAREGAAVLLNDIDGDRAADAAARIREEGGVCEAAQGDVGEVSVVRGLVAKAVERFGRLDVAVANAGLTQWNTFLDYEPTDFRRVLDVNLQGSFFLAQAAGRQMRAQGEGGSILFMSSVTGHQAIRYLSAYSLSKAALEMLARQLVVEISQYGIRVNAVAPGAIVTPRNLADQPDYEEVWDAIVPIGRTGHPQDIANTALFLLSDDARQINGQTIVVDGGWTATSPAPVQVDVEGDN